MRLAIAWMVSALLLGPGGCGGAGSGDGPGEGPGDRSAERPDSCPAQADAPHPLPGVSARHRTLAYWLERAPSYGDVDATLLTPDEIEDHNRALALPVDGRPLGQADLHMSLDEASLLDEVRERLAYMLERIASGVYLDEDGDRLPEDERAAFEAPASLPTLSPELRRAEELVSLRCGPREEGLYTESLDLAFDRNSCSAIHPGEVVQVLGSWPGGLRLARTPYALGFIASDAALSAPLAGADAPSRGRPEGRALTRRAVLEEAFALLDTPYGWGGREGGRDCSRFLMDVLGSFGLGLPRHSGRQALSGTFSVDVSSMENMREKELLLESAARRGVVLMHFPGHIMLYLGRTEEGAPMAIHSFSEYLEPCGVDSLPSGEPPEILRRVDRVTVSDLSLGHGTSRRSFIERLTRVTVFGGQPGLELRGAAELRAAAPVSVPEERCDDSTDVAIFRSPARPNQTQPMKVIVTSTRDPGPVDLVLIDPTGERHTAEVMRLGGPPYTFWAKVDSPRPGRWTAVLGDGSRVLACERFGVSRAAPEEAEASPYAWEARWRWETDTENLYAAFIEQLFDYPVEDDRTWTNLQSLLQDRDRNLLFDHLSQNEDSQLRLQPDCADLPYFLRAYYAWKLRLPFAFRRCSRGRAGQPPNCGALNTNMAEREGHSDISAFGSFIRSVANGVHSASARTHPNDDSTDVYPVPMTREALRPGTVFADPYGHLLVVADWLPQGTDRYGVLVGADAQPDGTIGRRRFWRGSFLFTTDTTDVGAGFKAWRPLVYSDENDAIESLSNADLRRSNAHVRHSGQQYEGTANDWYDRMGALVNPRPLDPMSMMRSLVDALDESVARRVVSVSNGVEFQRGRSWSPIPMPEGYSIFETTGPWEDFSTPARDLRLLISIDAVWGFPDEVARSPSRFDLTQEQATAEATRLRAELQEELSRRAFTYVRSDGTEQSLSLADVVERRVAFEMAYNPNDCVEIRWAASEGSAEHASCNRRAPRAQRQRMLRYRSWFENRQRPPR